MPRYEVKFNREITITENRTIYIQADNNDMASNIVDDIIDQLSEKNQDEETAFLDRYPGSGWIPDPETQNINEGPTYLSYDKASIK